MSDRNQRFEAIVLPHLDAAFNLARWLLRDEHHAQDVVQEAFLRSFKFFDSFRGGDARPWVLGIVRNTCFTWMRAQRQRGDTLEFDEALDSPQELELAPTPESLLQQKHESQRLDRAIAALPAIFREVIVLRELEDLSYEDIAQCAAIPVGTVMSRLSRARAMLRADLSRDTR